MSEWHTMLVVQFFVSDEDEGIYFADDPQSFDETDKLLTKLRAEKPHTSMQMYAELA